MVHRAAHYCSNTFLFNTEISNIIQILKESAYPQRFIDYHVQKAIKKFSVPVFNLLPGVQGPILQSNINICHTSSNSAVTGNVMRYMGLPLIKGTETVVKNVTNKCNL